jgi:hypothetical protein
MPIGERTEDAHYACLAAQRVFAALYIGNGSDLFRTGPSNHPTARSVPSDLRHSPEMPLRTPVSAIPTYKHHGKSPTRSWMGDAAVTQTSRFTMSRAFASLRLCVEFGRGFNAKTRRRKDTRKTDQRATS